MTKQSMQNDTHDTINKIEYTYIKYKYINYVNKIFSIFIILLSGILLYNIFKINIREDATKNIIISSSWIIFIMLLKIVTSRSRILKYRDEIFNLAIKYYKEVYKCIENDTKIEKISYFDIINISSVYERCLELNILNQFQLDNLSYLIRNLENKYYY